METLIIPILRRFALSAFFLGASSASTAALAQTVIFSDGFESGFANWTVTGLWNLENDTDLCGSSIAPMPEGLRCAYYGIDTQCNYDTGSIANAGNLTLASPIALPMGFHALSLHCWMLHDTEPCLGGALYDVSTTQVSANGGATWGTVATRCFGDIGAPNFWNPRGIDLTQYAGMSILLRFHFDSVDEIYNSTRGVFLDRITIQGESGYVFCTSTCPCAGPFNFQVPGPFSEGGISGCRNSFHRDGELAGSGTTSVSSDTLVLNAIQMPPMAIALLAQSNGIGAGAFNGEGRLCLSGSPLHLGVVLANSGVASFPAPGTPPLSVTGLVPPSGGTRHYQVRYRDVSSTYCNATNFNWTNGYSIYWGP